MISQIHILLRRDSFRIAMVFLAVLLTLLVVVVAYPPLLTALRVLLGLVFVLIMPGFALQMALFPRRGELDALERLALSFGLSLAVISVLALLLDTLHAGIRLLPILVSETGVILLFSLVAYLRRGRLPPGERPQVVKFNHLRLWWGLQNRADRRLYAVLAGALLTALFAVSAILLFPGPAHFYTEFYMLGPDGKAEAYPREAKLGQDLLVTIGVANHEQSVKTYRVEIRLADPQTPGKQQQVGEAGPFTLQPGETLESPVRWQMPWTGQDQAVDLVLFDSPGMQPYRSLRLMINVAP